MTRKEVLKRMAAIATAEVRRAHSECADNSCHESCAWFELIAHDAAQRARIAELEAEVARLKKGREWQPIKTAPRDGTWVLGANARHGVYGIEFLRYNHAEGWCNAEGIEAAPTHWLPRPAPPSAREKP